MEATGATREVERRAEKAKSQKEGIEKVFEFSKNYKMGEDISEGIKDGLGSLSGKDLLGVGKAGFKLSASLLKGVGAKVLPGIIRKSAIAGVGLSRKGGSLQRLGKKTKGPKGLGLKALGGTLKGLGRVMKSIGPLIGTLAKMGPLLAASASIFMAIVKLIMDVEAAAKGMNKEILEGAGTADMLYQRGKNSVDAFKKLDGTLDSIRGNATDIRENLKWGTNADDIIKTTNALSQQGVSFSGMEQSFEGAGNSADEASRQVQSFGDMARMSLGYSRLLGVSINEITDLQAEMFKDIGISLSGTKLEFARMTREAAESGIGTNKFFSILRGVSSDLSLYTTRIGQAATMLKLMGKVMSPRSAAAFMSSISKGMKGLTAQDRVQKVLLAGAGKARSIAVKDIESKQRGFIGDLQKSLSTGSDKARVADLVKKAIGGNKESYKELQKVITQMPQDQQGALRETLSSMKMMQKSLSSGGTLGLQQAVNDFSMGATAELKIAGFQRFGGKKKLREMTGDEIFRAVQGTQSTDEEFKQFAMLEESIDNQRDRMVDILKTSDKSKLTKDDLDLWGKMQEKGLTDQSAVSKTTSQDIIDTIETGEDKALEEAKRQQKLAMETSKATMTVADKMGVVIEGIFEYLYVKLKGVLDVINDFIDLIADSNLFLTGDPRAESKEMEENLLKNKDAGNSKVIDAMFEAGRHERNLGEKGKKWGAVLGPALEKGVAKAVSDNKSSLYAATLADKEKKAGKKLKGDELEAFNKDFGSSYDSASIQRKLGSKVVDDLQEIFKGFQTAGISKSAVLKDQIKGVIDSDDSLSSKKKDAFKKNIDAGGDFLTAIKAADFSVEDVQRFMGKAASIGATLGSQGQIGVSRLKSLAGQDPVGVLESVQSERDAKDKAAKRDAEYSPEAPKGQTEAAKVPEVPQIPEAPSGQTEAAARSASPGVPPEVQSASPAPQASSDSVFYQQPSMSSLTSDPAVKDLVDGMDSQGKETVRSLQELWNALRRQGIKLDKTQLEGKVKDIIEKGTLPAMREALFEYAVYSAEDPKALLEKMQKTGFKDLGPMAKSYAEDTKNKDFLGASTPQSGSTSTTSSTTSKTPPPESPFFAPPSDMTKASANASGGIVSGIANGMANVVAAPGEGLASIGKGERIVPAGKGGGAPQINLTVQGIGGQDLANLLKEKIAQGIFEYKRREKFN